jgi:uncharacterized protein (TIGR02145 family)
MKTRKSTQFQRSQVIISFFIVLATACVMYSCQQTDEILGPEAAGLKSAAINNSQITYWGHEKFTRETGKPAVIKMKIGSEDLIHFESTFVLHIQNGNGITNLVSSAIVKVDGKQIFVPSDFSKKVTSLSKTITGLTSNSELEVELRSTPGSYLDIWIEGTLKKDNFQLKPEGGNFTINESSNILNGFKLTIPGGLTDKNLYFSIKSVDCPLFNENLLKKIGPAVSIDFEGLPNQLSKPCTVSLPINCDITDVPLIGYFNEDLNKWEYIKVDAIDENNSLVFQTNHFSIYSSFFYLTCGIHEILYHLETTFIEARDFLNGSTFDFQHANNLIDKLKLIEQGAENKINQMQVDYDNCRNIITCRIPFSDFQQFIIDEASTQSIELILTEVVLKGIEGKAIVSTAFFLGDLITGIILVDCISCFLPNSTVSCDFWENYFKEITATELIKQIEEKRSGTLIDLRDGMEYKTLSIGNQIWMAENLAYLPSVNPPSSSSYTVPQYYVYGYNGSDKTAAKATTNYTTYGVLYNWTAAMNSASSSNSVPSGVQGICPDGWHLPSDAEWQILETNLGLNSSELNIWGWRESGQVGKQLKSSSGWFENGNGDNTSGFNAKPAGYFWPDVQFNWIGKGTWMWSSTEVGGFGCQRTLYYYENGIFRYYNQSYKNHGFSVRCVKNTP